MSQDLSSYSQYNPARNTSYVFTVTGQRDLSFKLKNASVTSVQLGATPFETAKQSLVIPSNKLDYSPLPLRFLVSEDLREWIDVFQWMSDLTHYDENYGETGELTILDSQNRPVVRFIYRSCWPLTLGDIQYSIDGDEQVISCDVVLQFDSLDIEIIGTGEKIIHAP